MGARSAVNGFLVDTNKANHIKQNKLMAVVYVSIDNSILINSCHSGKQTIIPCSTKSNKDAVYSQKGNRITVIVPKYCNLPFYLEKNNELNQRFEKGLRNI